MQPTLTPIEAKIDEDHVVIPKGMTLVFLQKDGDRFLAWVHGWTSAGEYDATDYDLYSLENAHAFTISCKMNGEPEEQRFWFDFKQHTKEPTKGLTG
jgi:hypothetical protein